MFAGKIGGTGTDRVNEEATEEAYVGKKEGFLGKGWRIPSH